MNGMKPILLVVKPDDHYMDAVAIKARDKGLIDGVRVADATAESFADAIGRLDKGNLIIAKGMLETADFLRLILKYNGKELIAGGADGFLSHCYILQKKGSRPLLMTDIAILIAPDAEQKLKIARNAADMARTILGVKRPVVSILTPSGKYNPAIKSSVDGDYIIRQMSGDMAEVRLDQMDTAVSNEARKAKGLGGGTADILLADNLDSGNSVAKVFTMVAGYDAAGLVCGTTVPVALNSRADSVRSKLLSIKYAANMLWRQK
jgi:phosphotransacetylase